MQREPVVEGPSSLRRRSWLVALGFFALSACDASPAVVDLEVVTGDTSDTSDAPDDLPPNDADAASPDVAACAAPTFGAASALVGLSDLDGCYVPLAGGTTLEIVHGIQGGIHVELRLAIATPQVPAAGGPSVPTVTWDVEVAHDGTTLARFAATLGTFEALGPSAQSGQSLWAWASPAFPVVFASADAALYHGLTAEVRATLDVDGRRQTLGPIPVHLADPFLSPPPR
jgi:hypothetical protein